MGEGRDADRLINQRLSLYHDGPASVSICITAVALIHTGKLNEKRIFFIFVSENFMFMFNVQYNLGTVTMCLLQCDIFIKYLEKYLIYEVKNHYIRSVLCDME